MKPIKTKPKTLKGTVPFILADSPTAWTPVTAGHERLWVPAENTLLQGAASDTARVGLGPLARDHVVQPRQDFKVDFAFFPFADSPEVHDAVFPAGGGPVYEPKVIRSVMRFPRSWGASKTWAPCKRCGEPTKALNLAPMSFIHDEMISSPAEPLHLICRHVRFISRRAFLAGRRRLYKWPGEQTMNRHDRRRAGLPRPPMPQWVIDEMAADAERQAYADEVNATLVPQWVIDEMAADAERQAYADEVNAALGARPER